MFSKKLPYYRYWAALHLLVNMVTCVSSFMIGVMLIMGEVRLGHLFILALLSQVMGRMCQVMGHMCFIIHDWGYAYYGEVRLGHLFILALLGQVMGHMCQVMGSMCQVMGRMCQVMGRMCQVMGHMCQVMKKLSIKYRYHWAQEIFERKSVARFFETKKLEL